MSVDKRRNNGPEDSYSPFYEVDEKWLEEQKKKRSSKGKARDDGRQVDELRPIFLQCGLIPQATGSAYIETQGLKIACAVYGPRQIRGKQYSGKAELHVDVRYAAFASEARRRPGKDTEAPSASHHIYEALLPSLRLDLLPKASIDLFLTILQADAPEEGCIAAAVTVASTALAAAGVEMYGLVAGVCGLIASEDDTPHLVIDPTATEAKGAEAWMQLNSMPALGSITTLRNSTSSGLTLASLDAMTVALLEKSVQVHSVIAKSLSEAADSA